MYFQSLVVRGNSGDINPNRAGIVFFDTLFSKTVFKPCCLNQKFFVTTCYGSHFFLQIFFNYIRISINSLFRFKNGVFIKKNMSYSSLYFRVQHSMCVIIIKTSDFVTAPSGIVFQNPLCCCGGGGRFSQRQYSVAFFDLYFRH